MFTLQKDNVVKTVDRIDKRDRLLAAGFCLVQQPNIKPSGGGRGRKYDAVRDVKITAGNRR